MFTLISADLREYSTTKTAIARSDQHVHITAS